MTVAAAASGGRRLSLPWQLVIAAVILVLSWPFRTQFSQATLEVSWQLGLHQAIADGLQFGRDVVFTYGPLGFLAWPTPFIGPTSALAFLASGAVYLALVWLLLHAALRLFPAWVAVLLALAFARALTWLEPFEALQILAFGLGVEVLRRDSVPKPWRVAVVAGLLAGVAILGKVNVGVVVGAMAVVVVLAVARPRLTGLVILAGVTAATTVGLWLVAGQQLPDLVAYARGSAEIIAGYSDAMGVTPANARFVYAGFVLVAVVILAVAHRTAVRWPVDRRLALAALVFLLLIACWKFAFVRSHVASTFAMLGFATLFLVSPGLPRRFSVPAIAVVGGAFLLVITPAAPGYPTLPSYPDVVTSATDALRQARDAVLPWEWDAAAGRTREHLRAAYPVPPSILAELDGRTVTIDPSAAAIASAYPTFRWSPAPIFQSYSAYTAALDRLDADRLRSDERPERILREYMPRRISGGRTVPYAIDGRNYWFESPEATIERLCRYREVAASGDFQVLADSGETCGEETPLATVTARFGESVTVPASASPDDIVGVRLHGVGDGLLARLRATLWRSPAWSIRVDGDPYRLVRGTAGDGLVLAVPAAAQGSAPFAFGDPVRTIEIDGSRLGGGDTLTYEFFTRRLPGS